MDASSTVAPGVIVIAEPAIFELLSASGAQWDVQERQPSVDAMWTALSAGTLNQRSRVLVFSDSLAAGTPDDETELNQTARAMVAMAAAGAHVFYAEWRPDERPRFTERLADAARDQGAEVSSAAVHRLPVDRGGLEVLEALRSVLDSEVQFPREYGAGVDAPLTGGPVRSDEPLHVEAVAAEPDELADLSELADLVELVESGAPPDTPPQAPVPQPGAPTPAAPSPEAPAPIAVVREATPAPGLRVRPSMPPIGGVSEAAAPRTSGYPASASLELLERPKRPGQTTITVTSSKGGSGKSTASILLAGSIARASADAGSPLSVCLIDLDTRDGQVASLIGKFMPTALNIRVQPVWDEERIRRNLVHADGLGIDTLLAPIRPRTADTVGPDFYRTIVRSLQRMYDVVIMDTSVQYLEPLIAEVALGEADEILFVTTLASTAVQGMARALREITAPVDESGLGIPREKIGIIVNQSVANVGMERDQVLAAGLGVPVVGVIPLATKDVLTATNLNRMYALLDHPLLGPAYNELGRACLPGRELGSWKTTEAAPMTPSTLPTGLSDGGDLDDAGRKRGLFRR
jgi:cellulose biosynthesis protein BcsQ